jgi:hypothetical protein
MSMKTAANLFTLLSVSVMVIFQYYLLTFIDARGSLWWMWSLSVIMALGSALLGAWARDEYYKDSFMRVLAKAEAA